MGRARPPVRAGHDTHLAAFDPDTRATNDGCAQIYVVPEASVYAAETVREQEDR